MKKTAILVISLLISMFCYAQNIRPMVSNISTSFTPETSHMVLTWSLSNEAASQIQELLIYKNEDSIINGSTLSHLNAYAKLDPTTSYFSETIKGFSAYYYAVVARTNDGSIYDVIIPTVNATDKAIILDKVQVAVTTVEIDEKNVYENATPRIDSTITAPLRERPLPYLDIIPQVESTHNAEISNKAIGVDSSKNSSTVKELFLGPHILEDDKNEENAIGDDYTLSLIVNTYVANEDWENAQIELLEFLQINRSEASTARAHFYLGQSLYFQNDFRKALNYFQRSEKLYPAYSKRWIEESLNRFSIS